MKKRTVIAVILTGLIIILTNKSWLTFKPISIDFNIQSKGKLNIEVQLNKKDNNEFNKTKSANNNYNLSKTEHVNLKIKKIIKPKRIRIIISNIEYLNPIRITNIQLNKHSLINLKEIDIEGASSTKTENELILNPKQDVIILTYPKTLNVISQIEIDFALLLIIIILSYLLAYKLANYTAEFNTIHKKSRTEIIFLSIFFVFLFIPMSYIDNSEISKHENRTLAKLSPLINKDGQINYNFTKEFSLWFNDRFNLRKNFILNKNWKTKDVFKGKNNWLFLGWQESKYSYTNQNLFTEIELKKLADYLNSINTYCTNNNKHFYFLIAPDKARIYPEYYPDDIKPLNSQSLSQQVIEYLNENTNVNVIYPKNEIISKKGNDLFYFKQDTHWTPLGAYITYLELMKKIKKDYKDINVYEAKNYIKKDFTGDLYKMSLKSLRKKDNTLYKIPDINNDSLCNQNSKNLGKIIDCYNKNSNIDLVVYRDSFSTYLIPYFCESFGKSRYLLKYKINSDDLKKADVVILEVVERNIPSILKAIEENKNAV